MKNGILDYYCLDEQDEVLLNGIYRRRDFSYISCEILICVNDTGRDQICNSTEDIQAFFYKNPSFEILTQNSYFQPTSYDEPVNTVVSSTVYDFIDYDFQKIADIYLSRSSGSLEDD